MTDDPREILRAAGVECPDELSDWYDQGEFKPWMCDQQQIVETFTALARLVAEYKAQAESDAASRRPWGGIGT